MRLSVTVSVPLSSIPTSRNSLAIERSLVARPGTSGWRVFTGTCVPRTTRVAYPQAGTSTGRATRTWLNATASGHFLSRTRWRIRFIAWPSRW